MTKDTTTKTHRSLAQARLLAAAAAATLPAAGTLALGLGLHGLKGMGRIEIAAVAGLIGLMFAPAIYLALMRALQLRSHGAAQGRSGAPALQVMATTHRQVRLAMYALLLAAGGHAGFQAWHAERTQAARDAEASLADLAGVQRMYSQRFGRLATLIGSGAVQGPRRELRDTLEQAKSDSQRLQHLIATVVPADDASLQRAVQDWAHTRERLSDHAESLLHALESGPAADVGVLTALVGAESEPALSAARRLVDELERSAQQRRRHTAHALKLWAALSILLLAGLAIWVAEPTARTVKSQYLRLAAQTRELERLALVAELTTNAVMITDAQQRIVWVNDAFARITGFSLQEALGKAPRHLLPGELTDPEAKARIHAAIGRAEGVRAQVQTRRKGGSKLWLDLDIQPLRGGQGTLTGFVAVATDITERRRAQADQRIAAIAFDSQDAVVITDAEQIILRVNPAFTRITGYSAEEAVGRITGQLLKSGRQDANFYAAMWQSLRDKRHWQGEIWNRRKDGTLYPEWLSITAVTDDNDQVVNYVAVFSDITQKKQVDETIYQLAFYDSLTGLPNRRLLLDRLAQTLAASERHQRLAAVLFIDLDHFKELNDAKGHDIGDALLIEVAKRLQASVRASDTVARQGGDEFVVLLPDLSEQAEHAAVQAEAIAEKIRAAVNQPYLLKGHECRSTPSIGIGLVSGQDTTVEDLLKRADTAMYEAKRSGRNAICFFDPATHAAMQARIALEADLRQALPAGQLRLHYQMQVERGNRVVGAEVLLRWQHPQRGLVPPAQFIALAEETDLILPIGHWVLESACEQLRIWQQDPATRELELAVNVSARQFRQPAFVEQVAGVLERSGVDPRRLSLELTESVVLTNLADTAAKMQRIKALGVRFSIDDFGTGHSSLAYLTRLPLDQLKIDQTFVRNIAVTPTDAVVVQAIIGMARNLGLQVIAEGVETAEERDFLERSGCWHYQGHLFGAAVPIAEFSQALNNSSSAPPPAAHALSSFG